MIPRLVLALLVSGTSPDPLSLADLGAQGLLAVRPSAAAAHVRFLSDDLLEGRGAGTRGHALAERYVAAAFESLGLEPAGEGGTWFQDVPLRTWKVEPARSRLEMRVKGRPALLRPGRDYYLLAGGDAHVIDRSSEVVFAGFGIVAPEYGWDDLAGRDLTGKIALILDGAPAAGGADFFPDLARAVFADRCAKLRRLRDAGAVGAIMVYTPHSERRLPWTRAVAEAGLGGYVGLEEGKPATTPAGISLRAVVTGAAFDRILESAGTSTRLVDLLAAASRRQPLALPPLSLRATAHVEVDQRDLVSRNVLGLLQGRDEALAEEPVVLMAHLDHLGIGRAVNGDSIYNGAADNATGVAELLEAARAFTALPDRPRRSVLFAAVTGEEFGFIGSLKLAAHPVRAGMRYAAVLNVDEASWISPLRDIIALGADESTLDRHVRAAAEALGLVVSPDPEPEAAYFVRSDQWSFAKAGVPGVLLFDGFLDETGRTSRKQEAFERFERERYHSPRDELESSFDPHAMADFSKVVFLIGLSVAEDTELPRWNEQSFLARFARRSPVRDACFPVPSAP